MTNRLYVGNLSWNTTQESLEQHFNKVGVVVTAKIVMDRETGRSKGFAFINMGTAEQAQTAIVQLNQTVLDGRPLRVNEAIPMEQKPRTPLQGFQPARTEPQYDRDGRRTD